MNLIRSSTCCEENLVLNDGIPSPPSRICFRKSESGCRTAWPSRKLGTRKRVPSSSFTGPPLPSTPWHVWHSFANTPRVAANGSGVAAAVALFAEGLVVLVGDVVLLL